MDTTTTKTADLIALTKPQRLALEFLDRAAFATPQQIGYAMTPDRDYPLKPQGAGRIGGAMGCRLVRMGLAHDASLSNSGFSAYSISRQGRAALRAREVT